MNLNARVTLPDGRNLAAPLSLLEESLRDGEPVPDAFAKRLAKAVENGDLEVLTATAGDKAIGVAILAYRLNVTAGDLFASLEDVYVSPGYRRRGVGRELIQAVQWRCKVRNVSYVEVQVEEKSAEAFYEACGYERESGVRVMSVSYVL